MKKEVMEKWVAALRSGEHGQCQGTLKHGTREYCCLGVLCEISKIGNWVGSVEKGFHYRTDFRNSSSHLPSSIQRWAEMKTDYGYLKGKENLMNMNDNGKSFKEIADVIENNWKEL